MNYKYYFKTILTITLALVMAFTPVLSNWPYLAYSYGTDDHEYVYAQNGMVKKVSVKDK